MEKLRHTHDEIVRRRERGLIHERMMCRDWLVLVGEVERLRKLRRKECTEFASIAGVDDSRDTRIVLRDARVKIERLNESIKRIKFDSGAIEDVSFKVCEAAAAVVGALIGCDDGFHRESQELIDAINDLRIAAGIKSPPADETHDPDPDGDRLGEGR